MLFSLGSIPNCFYHQWPDLRDTNLFNSRDLSPFNDDITNAANGHTFVDQPENLSSSFDSSPYWTEENRNIRVFTPRRPFEEEPEFGHLKPRGERLWPHIRHRKTSINWLLATLKRTSESVRWLILTGYMRNYLYWPTRLARQDVSRKLGEKQDGKPATFLVHERPNPSRPACSLSHSFPCSCIS